MKPNHRKGYAGYLEVQLFDSSQGIGYPMTVMYPTDQPEQEERLGPYLLGLARDAELSEGELPLVLISHGTGGSPLVYRTLARHLARNGFIVGMPEHPHNNRNDNSLEGTIQNLANRPRHLRLAIDWFFEQETFRRRIQTHAVSVIGHSLGGYTALAVAGGLPTSFPQESADGQSRSIEVVSDDRVSALVLLAPATVWFRADDALRAVHAPILMLDAEKDPYTPSFHAQLVMKGVADPSKVRYRTVDNAGHFSFLSPFPPSMKSPSFLPSQDPPGFDRDSFHEWLNDEVLSFLR
ncbi:alpha/beta fold hydrolase [Paenibacillus sp. YYML68]|uniref:alpha/beta hydrolase family protein n=1 Tax=Paenibacillus sp. YYML68 TaxID=2909250 RepID=UPI0024925760|nr:alpha/beta fold hydrolase [Paenibacillus sp. YYML68]